MWVRTPLRRGVLNATLCDQVQLFSLCTPVSSINKTDHHDITETLLKVALNTTNKSIPPDNHKTLSNNTLFQLTVHITYTLNLTIHCKGSSPDLRTQVTTVNIDIFCTGPWGTSGVGSQYNVSIGFFCSFVCSLSLIANFYKKKYCWRFVSYN